MFRAGLNYAPRGGGRSGAQQNKHVARPPGPVTPLCAAQNGSSGPRHTRGRHRVNQGGDKQSAASPAETTDVLRQFSAARPPHAVVTAYPRLKKKIAVPLVKFFESM